MNKIISYFKEVRSELAKVNWPKKTEVTKLTLIVFIISASLGVYVGILDYTFTKLFEFIILK